MNFMQYSLVIKAWPSVLVDLPEIIINGKKYELDKEKFSDATAGYTDCWGEIEVPLKVKEDL